MQKLSTTQGDPAPDTSAALNLPRMRAPLTLREGVADQLRTAIVAGALPPGALLRETELALRLGVSATPVREALGELAAEGLVEVQTHRLKRVSLIEPGATADLLRVQAALWRMGYVWGLPNIGPAELIGLDAAVGAYQAALAARDIVVAVRAGHEFHTIFIAASGNSELLRVTLDRRSLIARFIVRHGSATISRSGLQQHRLILAAQRRGDPAGVLAVLDRMAAKLVSLAPRDAG